jgi:hypothetical protein
LDNELQIIGPKRNGIWGQWWTVAWKFYSTRFGAFGEAFNIGDVGAADVVKERALRAGRKYRRRLEGKNGWLWRYLMLKMRELELAIWDRDENYLKIPEPTWWRKIGLYLFFGYKYPDRWWED